MTKNYVKVNSFSYIPFDADDAPLIEDYLSLGTFPEDMSVAEQMRLLSVLRSKGVPSFGVPYVLTQQTRLTRRQEE